ncbi:MAG: beta-galactosidase [Thermoguttaceae bacterium]
MMKQRNFLGLLVVGGLISLSAGGSLVFGKEDAVGKAPASLGPTSPKTSFYYWSWWGWEPLSHYVHSKGSVVGGVNTSSPFLSAWYDRLHEEQTARMMSDLGVNLAVTHFFKGFGLNHEQDEIQRTKQLVEAAHRCGIRVMGYCQWQTIYSNTFPEEVPDAASWVQLDEQGKYRCWGSDKKRWAPCIHCREFIDYLKRVMRVGLEEVGLDGLHFDNDYFQPCYCKRCEAAFQKWMAARYPGQCKRFGVESFDKIAQPRKLPRGRRITDPLTQAWVLFRCESLGEVNREIAEYARSVRPDVIMLNNPTHPRGFNGLQRRALWPPMIGGAMDVVFAENGNFARMSGDALVSQIRAHKHAAAVGYRVVSTTWKQQKGKMQLPEKPEEVKLQVAEGTALNGIPGTNWALRLDDKHDGHMRIERPELREALQQYLGFAHKTEDLRKDARPVRDVAVLETFASMAYDATAAASLVQGVQEVLIRDGFPWETVFGDNMDRLKGFRSLVVAGQSYLSDSECRKIHEFVQNGGGLLLIGDNGHYDEQGRPRDKDPLADVKGDRVVRLPANLITAPAMEQAYASWVALSKSHAEIATAVQKTLGDQFSARVTGSDKVALSAYELPDGRLVVHLVNYAAPSPQEGLKLSVGPKWQKAASVKLLSPESSSALTGGATVELPPLPVYAVVVFEPQSK